MVRDLKEAIQVTKDFGFSVFHHPSHPYLLARGSGTASLHKGAYISLYNYICRSSQHSVWFYRESVSFET